MSLLDFVRDDNPRSFFPLSSNIFYIENGEAELRHFVFEDIFKNQDANFLSFPVAYALKDSFHLRRTLLLDPVATFYIYSFVLDNVNTFQEISDSNRRHYGYAFEGSKPLNSFADYHRFRERKYELKRQLKYFAKV